MKYCTYLTIYYGNKMPMFYIGRTTVENIRRGYRGSVSSKKYKDVWLTELQESPTKFKTKILTLHSSKKESAEQEEKFHTTLSVHKNSLYINQATANGKFWIDVSGDKNPMYGTSRSGDKNPMYGKKHTDESIEKMKLSGAGKNAGVPKSESFKQLMRNKYVGKSFEERYGVVKSNEMRQKLRAPKSEETKQKLRELAKARKTCEYCKKRFTESNYLLYHGDNCLTK